MTVDTEKMTKKNGDNLSLGARGGAIAFALKIANTGLAFINQIILARFLGASGVGEVVLAISVYKIFSQIAKFGMEETMMRFVPLYIDGKDNGRLKGAIFFAIKFSLLISAVLALLTVFLSRFIAVDIFHSAILLKIVPVVALAIPAAVVRDVIAGILKGYKDTYNALLPENLISPFCRILVFLLLMLIEISPLYAIIAFVSGEIVSAALSVFFLSRRLTPLKSAVAEYESRKILEVAYTIIFASVGLYLYTQTDIWVLGIFTTTSIVGIYGVASKLVLLLYFPMYAFASIIPPLMSSSFASGNYKELERITRESSRWMLSMAMPLILVLILEGKLVLRYFYGTEFETGYSVLVILTSVHLINTAAGLVGIFLQMTGQHKVYMKINILFGVLNVILNVLLVPHFGMVGAAAATFLCIAMLVIVSSAVIYKRFNIVTLAERLRFDICFVIVVLCLYVVIKLTGIEAGYHILFALSVTVYISKSVVCHDIPWRLLIAKRN